MTDFALLILRLVIGGLMIGHGAQKLFGSFGGYGLHGTAGWLESLGLRPGRPWAYLAGLSEFGGGLLTALGLFHPLGPIGVFASMGMATTQVHANKPIWVTEGGAELPLTNMAAMTALMIARPGRYSLDRALGLRLPAPLLGLITIMAVGALLRGSISQPEPTPQTEERAGAKLEAGVGAEDF